MNKHTPISQTYFFLHNKCVFTHRFAYVGCFVCFAFVQSFDIANCLVCLGCCQFSGSCQAAYPPLPSSAYLSKFVYFHKVKCKRNIVARSIIAEAMSFCAKYPIFRKKKNSDGNSVSNHLEHLPQLRFSLKLWRKTRVGRKIQGKCINFITVISAWTVPNEQFNLSKYPKLL